MRVRRENSCASRCDAGNPLHLSRLRGEDLAGAASRSDSLASHRITSKHFSHFGKCWMNAGVNRIRLNRAQGRGSITKECSIKVTEFAIDFPGFG